MSGWIYEADPQSTRRKFTIGLARRLAGYAKTDPQVTCLKERSNPFFAKDKKRIKVEVKVCGLYGHSVVVAEEEKLKSTCITNDHGHFCTFIPIAEELVRRWEEGAEEDAKEGAKEEVKEGAKEEVKKEAKRRMVKVSAIVPGVFESTLFGMVALIEPEGVSVISGKFPHTKKARINEK